MLISTDGACKGNPGPGTWAFVVFDKEGKMLGHKKGHSSKTTNNEMELTAILKALTWASKQKDPIQLMTDSNYCLQGIESWLAGWKKKGWKTTTGVVKNLELWKAIDEVLPRVQLTLVKVKGHSGNYYNDQADRVCNEHFVNVFF